MHMEVLGKQYSVLKRVLGMRMHAHVLGIVCGQGFALYKYFYLYYNC